MRTAACAACFHRFIKHNGTGERDLKATGELCAQNPPTRILVISLQYRPVARALDRYSKEPADADSSD